jgi:phosphate-selective porin OprO/OprP
LSVPSRPNAAATLCSAGRRRAALLILALTVPVAGDACAQSAAPAEEPPQQRFSFDVGWSNGPTYEFARREPTLDAIDKVGLVSDRRIRGRIGGSLYLDGGWRDVDDHDDGFRAKVRRARIYTQGEILLREWRTEYRLQFAVEGRHFLLNDFYLRWRPTRWVDTIRFGYFDSPISLEALASTSSRSMLEVPAAVAAFAPGYRLGIEVTDVRARPSLTWMLNLASVGQTQPFTDASSDTLRAIGRVVWRPVDDPTPGGTLLHLGLSTSFVLAGGGDLRYRARPESFLAPYLADTDTIDGNSAFVGLEAAWRRGPLSLQSEMLRSFIDADEEGSLTFHGLYGQASWVLTGESRPYDPQTAVFDRIVPERPFAPRRREWGALEVTARASWLDLSDGAVRGGRLLTLSAGPAWTWNRWVRLLAGYVFARTTDRADAGEAHIVQLRLELQL